MNCTLRCCAFRFLALTCILCLPGGARLAAQDSPAPTQTPDPAAPATTTPGETPTAAPATTPAQPPTPDTGNSPRDVPGWRV